MLSPTTLPDSRNATSSPGSAFGRMHCGGPGGETIRQFGQALAPANLSARQAKEMGLLTSGIYGPHGSILLRSAALQESLASKLQVTTALLGSTLFKLTWKRQGMPSGRWIYALRASARRTQGSAFTSWPTPAVMDTLPPRSDKKLARAKSVAGCSNLKDTLPLPIGFCAETASNARVNPVLSRGLISLPKSWDDCAATAMLLLAK